MSKDSLIKIRERFEELKKTQAPASAIEAELLGRSGTLPSYLRSLKDLSAIDRKTIGLAANTLRTEIAEYLKQASAKVESSVQNFPIDPTLPPLPPQLGGLHPINSMIAETASIFRDLAFEVIQGPEIVTDQDNFESLNITQDHPARDSHDSFYLTKNKLLRTQTTAVQVQEMRQRFKAGLLPIRLVVQGKTYRRESDQTHAAMFHQIDAVLVDETTTFADLKGTLDYFAKRLFGDTVITRFRPHYFPFTEPSAEMDIKLKNASGTGKHTGWLEFGGCGMIHPAVLERAGINANIYRGWAFGMSIERPIMLRHQIPDLRLLTKNSPAFLDQFH